MKQLISITAVVACLLMTSACKKALKNVKDYFPEVRTNMPVVTPDGKVLISADILSSGNEALEYIGFCMDTVPVPNMMSNQIMVNDLYGSNFSATYSENFDPTKIYYFRSWASNGNGYVYGNVVSIPGSSIQAVPVVAPCSLATNTSGLGLISSAMSTVYHVDAVYHTTSSWDIQTSGWDANAGNLLFSFASEPTTKVYTTTEYPPYGDYVNITLYSGSVNGVVKAGSKVYVNRQSPGVYEITICSAPWTPSGSTSTFTLNARFTSPYN